MRRLVFGLVLALCAISPAVASAATEVEAEFELPASNGLTVEITAVGRGAKGAVGLVVIDGDPSQPFGRYAVYQAKGKVDDSGIEASFGKLGHLSLQFRASSSKSGPGARNCGHEPCFEEREGLFEGEAEFRGEGGYVTVDANVAPGKLSIVPYREPPAGGRAGAAKPRRETGALLARADDGRFFYALGETDPRGPDSTTFLGEILEHSEGMRIGRVGFAAMRNASRFHFDHESGTATVRPPGPFSGRATFARHGSNPKQEGAWRGNLSVSLLGHAPIALAGPEFDSHLLRRSPFHDE